MAIKAWVAKMAADEVGAPTIENAFGLLRQVMGAALEDDRIARNPCDVCGCRNASTPTVDISPMPRCPRWPTRSIASLRWSGFWPTPACGGVKWPHCGCSDFDMLRRRVNVSRSVTESGGLVWSTPKTWERRSVPFPAVLADELAALMVGKARDDLVFNDMRGGVLRNSNWRARVFEPAVRKCQAADTTFPTITPHDLRHTAASLAVSAGANVKAVQRMLGHAKASMTLDVYADLFDEDLDGVADRLNAAIKSAAYPLRTGGSEAGPPVNS